MIPTSPTKFVIFINRRKIVNKEEIKITEISLNKTELEKILRLLDGMSGDKRITIKTTATGIADNVKVKIDGLDEEHDISDYDCW